MYSIPYKHLILFLEESILTQFFITEISCNFYFYQEMEITEKTDSFQHPGI